MSAKYATESGYFKWLAASVSSRLMAAVVEHRPKDELEAIMISLARELSEAPAAAELRGDVANAAEEVMQILQAGGIVRGAYTSARAAVEELGAAKPLPQLVARAKEINGQAMAIVLAEGGAT